MREVLEINFALLVSVKKVLNTFASSKRRNTAKQEHYKRLEIDGFWRCAGKKSNEIWLVYACHRDSGEIAASNLRFAVWETGHKAAEKLRRRMGTSYERIGRDDWQNLHFWKISMMAARSSPWVLKGMIAPFGAASGGFSAEPVVSPRNYAITGKPSIWLFYIQLCASK
ncbi:MAG: hypothetical protein LBG43_01115 [Treponema sp.]|nr:hypothetical protein [Treponema sp.]